MLCKLSLELFVSSVSCPGVFLGASAAPLRLSLCVLDLHGHTKPFPPSFPLLFRDKFVLERTLHASNLVRELSNESVYMELIQEPDLVLASFHASFLDFLGQNLPRINGKGRKSNVDLLMEPSKAFPGILAPKVEVTFYLRLESCSKNGKSQMIRVESVPPMHLHPHLHPEHHGHHGRHLHSRPFVWRRAEETLIGRRPVDLGPSQDSDSDSGVCDPVSESREGSKSASRGRSRRKKDEIKGLRGKSVTRHGRRSEKSGGVFVKRAKSAFDIGREVRREDAAGRGGLHHHRHGEVRQQGVHQRHGGHHPHGVHHHHGELFGHGMHHHDVHGLHDHDVHYEHVHDHSVPPGLHGEPEVLHEQAARREHVHRRDRGPHHEDHCEHGRRGDHEGADDNRRSNVQKGRSGGYSESDDGRRESDAARHQRHRRRHEARRHQEEESYDEQVDHRENIRRFHRRIRHDSSPFVVTICPDPLHCPYDRFYTSPFNDNFCPYYFSQQYQCSHIL